MLKHIIRSFLLLALLTTFAAASATTGPKVGQQAPEITGKDLQNKPHTLSDLRKDKPVLLVFWSTLCHVCHAMNPQFKQLHAKYGDQLTIAAVNVGNEDREEIDHYAFEFKLDYLILYEDNDDKFTKMVNAYRLRGTPTIQLIDQKGVVQYRGHRLPGNLDALLAAQ